MPRETLCRNDEARILREFVGAPLRPAHEPPVRQLLLERTGGGATLATRFHHAVGDLLSCSMWVGHQLRVVFGNEEMTRVRRSFHELVLKTHPSPRRRSPFAFQGPCHPLWCRGHEPSRQRRWQTLEIESLLSRRCSKTANGFTYNDLLLTCALEALIQWNRLRGHRGRKVGLWLPLDIRKRSFSGFGNGISRIRIYASYSEKLSFIQKCQHVRRQIDWSRRHGLWAVPRKHFLTRIPSCDGLSTTASLPESSLVGCRKQCFFTFGKVASRRRNGLSQGDTNGNRRAATLQLLCCPECPDTWRSNLTDLYLRSSAARNRGCGDHAAIIPQPAGPCWQGAALRVREQFNDALRCMLSRTLCLWGLLLQVVHQFRIWGFDWNQRRLRQRYGIDVNMPISRWDTQTERRLLQRAAKDSQLAQTSGSTRDPKRIPYSLRRLRSVRWTFQEVFSRAIWALGIRRTSLYFFGSLSRDRSLTSIVLAEKKLPLYLMTLQAPYRLQSHPAVQQLVNSYGTVAVRLWILVLSNPGILYSTNPSTLLVFFEELVSNWTRSVCLLRDYYEKPHQFRPSVHKVVRRLVSRGSEKRVAQVARAEGPVDLKVFCPGVQAYACWTSGYAEPFLQRLQTYLPPHRYRLIPMYSM